MKRTVSAMEARRSFGELLDGVRLRNDEVVIERNGKTVAVIVSPDRYEVMDGARSRFWELWDKVQASADVSDLTEDEVNELVDKEIREYRASKRRQRRSA
jgi:prevent-host-death family protein